MEKQQVSIDQSMFAAIRATEKVFRDASLLDPYDQLLLAEANIVAEASHDDGGEYSQHRNIKVDLVVENPEETGWISLSAECEVSEKDGRWVPRSVELWQVGTNWRRSATFHPSGIVEINLSNGVRIFS